MMVIYSSANCKNETEKETNQKQKQIRNQMIYNNRRQMMVLFWPWDQYFYFKELFTTIIHCLIKVNIWTTKWSQNNEPKDKKNKTISFQWTTKSEKIESFAWKNAKKQKKETSNQSFIEYTSHMPFRRVSVCVTV